MKEAQESALAGSVRRLSDAIREVKNAAADRDDVVVELREATRMRLELLAAELAPVFAEVPDDMENFDFAISSGLQPRLWIDAVAHVAMGRDRRTYRFVRDSRVGRIVLAESHDMKTVAAQVTRYVAERVVERQRLLDGGAEPAVELPPRVPLPEVLLPRGRVAAERRASLASNVRFTVAGVVFGLVASIYVLWDRLVAMWSGD